MIQKGARPLFSIFAKHPPFAYDERVPKYKIELKKINRITELQSHRNPYLRIFKN